MREKQAFCEMLAPEPICNGSYGLKCERGKKILKRWGFSGVRKWENRHSTLIFWHTLTCLSVLLWDNGNEMRRIGIYRGGIDREKSRFSVCFSGISWILTAKNVFFTAFGIFSLHFYRVEIRNNGKFAQNISKWAFTSIYKHTQEYANISVWGLYL